MALDLVALAAELTLDPDGLGLLTMSDAEAADALNLIREGDPLPYPQWKDSIRSADVIGNTDPAEWSSLSAAEKQRYLVICSAGEVDVTYDHVRAAFAAMFSAGTATRDALVAVARRAGSRTEALFGRGVRVTPSDVADARRL